MITELQLRQLIHSELNEIYGHDNPDLGPQDEEMLSRVIWNVLDTDALVREIVRRTINAYNGSKNETEAYKRIVKATGSALEGRHAAFIADAILNELGHTQ